MMARSSAGFRPGLKSTSQPRSEKISTARGDSSSEMSTLGFAMTKNSSGRLRAEFPLYLAVSPVKPRQQGLEIGFLHRGAAPDTQARRGVAVGAKVVARLFALEQVGHLRGGSGLPVGRQGGEPWRRDGETDRGVGADRLVGGEEADPCPLGDE